MLDTVTLDQLRTFLTVVEAGSFSAAARKLQRVQSAVSQAMSNLEQQLGVTVWDRGTRIPTLTDQGRVILAAAQRVCAQVDGLRRVAEGLSGGLEPSVSLVVDAVFPVTALVDLCREFARAFPTVELRLSTETLSAVTARVLDGSCQIGVAGPAAEAAGLTRRHLTYVRMVPVCSADHPLAALRGRIPTARAAEHVQIVFSERGGDDKAPDQAVLSPQTWRVVDLGTKHALLCAGLGWGNMPEHLVRAELAQGKLRRLRLEAWGDDDHLLSLSTVHRPGLLLGPATRFLLARAAELCARDLAPVKGKAVKPAKKRR